MSHFHCQKRMESRVKRAILSPISFIPERIGNFVISLLLRRLKKEICGEVTEKFLNLLFSGMDLAFALSRGYRKNIKGFKGRYLFRTYDNSVLASLVFENDDMNVREEGIDNWHVRVTFKDENALWQFIFSKDQDILDSLLKNEVEVDGNLNYIYKFCFMVKDLRRRLGVK